MDEIVERGELSADLAVVHELARPDETGVQPIYYISDLHIEHQLDLNGKGPDEVRALVRAKTDELVESLTSSGGAIILLGDIADDSDLAELFYDELVCSMTSAGARPFSGRNPWIESPVRVDWRVFAVSGNHELWGGGPFDGESVTVARRAFDPYERRRRLHESVELQRKGSFKSRKKGVAPHEESPFGPLMNPLGLLNSTIAVLQNELIVDDVGRWVRCLDEEKILAMDEGELRKCVERSTFSLLGGMGFTGLDHVRGAAAGAYGSTMGPHGRMVLNVTPEQDAEQSMRFRALHDKLVRCAGDLPVIVATHTPMRCWSDGQPNPGWVYLSGHTHINEISLEKGGAAIIADNQVGYMAGPWRFKSFTRRCAYDPFEDWGDGIYEVTGEQYLDFNFGRGISIRPGSSISEEPAITVLKRDGVYMFFVDTPKGPRWLMGGRKRVPQHDIAYYYDRLGEYRRRVEWAFAPYRHALAEVAHEVRVIGGAGTIHGCVVDVDFYHHVYLNPFDGTVAPYVAFSMIDKVVYDNIPAMLEGTPYEECCTRAIEDGKLPLLAGSTEDRAIARVPEVVLDTKMYEPSRIMRSLQYLFEKGVVRVWNDDVFKLGHDELSALNQAKGTPASLE